MKILFDEVSTGCSKLVTKKYSSSFSLAVRLLSPSIRKSIYNIYAFVRFADEIVDSMHGYNKEELLTAFEQDYYQAYDQNISLNPILNSFQLTVKKYNIDDALIQSFLFSMKQDLTKRKYETVEEYNNYIYGSADVVGLMCLKVFVNGNEEQYQSLKHAAMKLGSAFQKINFLRDIKEDSEILGRSYFPEINLTDHTDAAKNNIISNIQDDLKIAYTGIRKLPVESRLGVYTSYVYYTRLLNKLKRMSFDKIINQRVRISNPVKLSLLACSFVTYKLRLI